MRSSKVGNRYLIYFSHIRVNDGVILTGWGSMTKLGNISAKLQHTRIIVEPQRLCNNSYNVFHSANPISLEIELVLPDLFQSNLMCAGSEVCSKLKNLTE